MWHHGDVPRKIHKRLAVSPIKLACPRCSAAPGIACVALNGRLYGIHLERIKAAAAMDRAAKNPHKKTALSGANKAVK
jgi:hypothetical protein